MRKRPPLFFRSVYDEHALDSCFSDLLHAPMPEQDKIEIGCLIQYFSILKHYGRFALPIDITKHRQGEGPDFTICAGEDGLFGVEMTKVTTQDYQVWLKRRRNYRAIRDVADYLDFRPEERVGELAAIRVMRKNYKIANYLAAVAEMSACDLVLEENGDCSLDPDQQMAVLRQHICTLRNQRFRRISMISGSVLFYAINTPEAEIFEAPESIPEWLRPPKSSLSAPEPALWH